MTKREELAAALHKAHYERGRGGSYAWETLNRWEKEMWLFSANAALAVMDTPTEAMLHAGDMAFADPNNRCKEIWSIMLRAAREGE